LIFLFSAWGVRELVLQSILSEVLDGVALALVGQGIKLLVWTLPAVLLIWYYRDDMWISFREMVVTRPQWFSDAPVLLIVFVPLLRAVFLYGGVGIHPDFQPERLIGAVLFVGITEEVVFRGFLLNALLKRMKLWSAIAVNEVFFVLIHFPVWIYQGKDLGAFAGSSMAVFLLGGVFSYSFVKARNIFVPIALHMTYNLLVVLFLG